MKRSGTVVTVKTTLTVNAAFLQEIKEVNQDLWTLFRSLRDTPRRSLDLRGPARRFVEELERLRDLLAMHFSLEEAFGYFEDPVSAAPRLSCRADALRAEHRELYVMLGEVIDLTEQLQVDGRYTAGMADEVFETFQAFSRRFEQHERAENELILEAFDDDIGVGD
ncbi:MAG: hemerythrin domain-containing protein [Pirellulales bacterium]